MLTRQRIFHDDNGTLTDKSQFYNDLAAQTSTLPIVAAQDKLYIGSDLPFNHRYFHITAANDQAGTISAVEIWDGTAWVAAVDVQDETSSSGVTFAQSGHVIWTKDRNKSWGQEATTEDITGLTSIKVYDFYWARFTFSADFNVATALNYVGFKFADDEDLRNYGYPDLLESDSLTAFESGKTDWEKQHFVAAEEIIRYLRKKQWIWTGNQILDFGALNAAGAHKCAEVIYRSFGKDYVDRVKSASDSFYRAINIGNISTDRDEDGSQDEREARPFEVTLSRV